VHRAARRPTKGFAADARSAAALLRWRLQPARGGKAGISEARAAEESAHAAASRAAEAAAEKELADGASAERLEEELDDEGQGKGGRGGVGSDSHSGICHGKTKCKYA